MNSAPLDMDPTLQRTVKTVPTASSASGRDANLANIVDAFRLHLGIDSTAAMAIKAVSTSRDRHLDPPEPAASTPRPSNDRTSSPPADSSPLSDSSCDSRRDTSPLRHDSDRTGSDDGTTSDYDVTTEQTSPALEHAESNPDDSKNGASSDTTTGPSPAKPGNSRGTNGRNRNKESGESADPSVDAQGLKQEIIAAQNNDQSVVVDVQSIEEAIESKKSESDKGPEETVVDGTQVGVQSAVPDMAKVLEAKSKVAGDSSESHSKVQHAVGQHEVAAIESGLQQSSESVDVSGALRSHRTRDNEPNPNEKAKIELALEQSQELNPKTDDPNGANRAVAAELQPVSNSDPSAATIGANASPVGSLARSGSVAARRGEESNGVTTLSPREQARLVQRVTKAVQAAQEHDGEIRLRLSPPELGSMRLQVRVTDGQLTARLEAESATTRQLLVDNLPRLRESLAEQGIQIQRFDVDLLDHRPPDQQGNYPGAGFGDRQQDRFPETSTRDDHSGNSRTGVDETSANSTMPRRLGDGRINIVI